MPTHERLRWNDRKSIQDRWKPSIQLDEEPAIAVRQPDSATHIAPQYDQRAAEHHILGRASKLNQSLSRYFGDGGDSHWRQVRVPLSSSIEPELMRSLDAARAGKIETPVRVPRSRYRSHRQV